MSKMRKSEKDFSNEDVHYITVRYREMDDLRKKEEKR